MPQASRVIASVARFRPNRQTLPVLLVVAMAALGTAHILVRTWTYGAAVGFDATHYLATAQNLAAGAGLKSFEGLHYVHWPPLFPMLLALFELIGLGAEEAGRWINAASFGLIVLVSGIWLTRTLRSRLLALGGTFAVLIAYPLIDRSSYLMTEPLFILLTLMALFRMESFLQSGKRTSMVLGAVLFGLAAVTRYTGIFGMIAGLLMVILRRGTFNEKLKSSLSFGAISSLPLAGALAYNQATAQTLTGGREFASGQSILDSMKQILSVFDQWIIPTEYNFVNFLYIPFILFFVMVTFYALLKVNGKREYSRLLSSSFLPFGLFILIYLGMITVITPLAAGTPIDSRYLLPVYVPTILVTSYWGDRLMSRNSGNLLQWVPVSVIMIGCIIHFGFTIQKDISDTSEGLDRGYPEWLHHTAEWDESETLSWLETNPVSGIVSSPAFDLVWYRSGAPASEGRYHWIGENLRSLVSRIPREGAHAVLVSGGSFPQAEYADTIRFLPGVEVVGEFSDGGVYRFPAGWRFDEAGYRANVNRYLNELTEESGELAASSTFDVYVNGRMLVYVREPCIPADTEAWFFLHIDPDDPADLPQERQQYGFDNLDFLFDRQATWFDGKCLTTVELPAYGIASIRTGQYDDTGRLWSVEFALSTGREQ